jgi:hypothetical protein
MEETAGGMREQTCCRFSQCSNDDDDGAFVFRFTIYSDESNNLTLTQFTEFLHEGNEKVLHNLA